MFNSIVKPPLIIRNRIHVIQSLSEEKLIHKQLDFKRTQTYNIKGPKSSLYTKMGNFLSQSKKKFKKKLYSKENNEHHELIEKLKNENLNTPFFQNPDNYFKYLLEQYKLCVEMADRVSARRSFCNKFFMALQTALITAIVIFFKDGPREPELWMTIPIIANLVLCGFWWRLIKSYRQLNTAKFKVIGAIEHFLPLSPFWKAEWMVLGRGKNTKKYYQLTKVEGIIPIIFIIMYLLFAIVYYMFSF